MRGRRVIVTGASRGIGQAIAQAFAAEGCSLLLVARGNKALAETRDDIVRAHQVEVDFLGCDMTHADAPEIVAAACSDADILINNAGGIMRGDLLAVDGPAWRQSWEAKIFGYIDLARACYAKMRARGAGVIVNIIGIGGDKVEHDYVAGSTGNAALAGFTRALGGGSIEHGVRVVGVSPGWVETDRSLSLLRGWARDRLGAEDRWPEIIASWPLTRLVKPKEVAEAVVYLASPRASAISGQVLAVDLGLTARSYPPLPEQR